MINSEEILSLLGPATGLLIILLLMAVKTLWKQLMKVTDKQAEQNVVLAKHLSDQISQTKEMRDDIKRGFADIMSAMNIHGS